MALSRSTANLSAQLMATIKPFPALRPKPELAVLISAPPYDVLSTEEARATASGNPLSFLHVTKPEIDFPAGADVYSPDVYARGRENLKRLMEQGALRTDSRAAFYIYREIQEGHEQTGLVALASVQEYEQQIIRRHELTRIEKEEDRARHIATLNAQTGPAFLVYRDNPALSPLKELATRITAQPPEVDFTAGDGVRHIVWPVVSDLDLKLVQEQFNLIPRLYIADGHHRTAAAARVSRQRGGGVNAWFLAVIFSNSQVRILPYNRLLKDLNGLAPAEFLKRIETVFEPVSGSGRQPEEPHEVGLYLQGRWRLLRFKQPVDSGDLVERLDATVLQRRVLGPLLGIEDPRTSPRIHFIGGLHGVAEMEKLVNSGQYACAFSLCPVRIDDLMAVADAGGILPPKSTWFEPKLRDGLFTNLLPSAA